MPNRDVVRRLAPDVIGFGLPFVLVLYLALRGGGYDVLIRDEAAIAVWIVVMICALVGVPLLGRLERPAWIALGLLAGLTLWIGLATLWSESAERSVEEWGRVGTYLGVFVLALAVQGRAGLRRTLFGVTAAIGVVGMLAALSRMHPGWFPENEVAGVHPSEGRRLNYPLNYWNGLGTFLAMGLPLLLAAALDARQLLARVLASAAIPLAGLAMFLSFSRGAWLTAAIALGVYFAVRPERVHALPAAALAGAGAAALILAAVLRDDLQNGLGTPLALDQGDEMLAISIAVCAVVMLLRIALDRAERRGFELRAPVISRQASIGAVAAVAAVAVIALAASGVLSDAWEQFKQPTSAGTGTERLTSAAGNGRFEYWGASLDAAGSAPLTGIGPGSWDLWWSREATIPGFTRDAHSLYLETFAEIGVIGLVLLGGFLGAVVGAGVARSRRAPDEERALLAGALGAALAFCVAMALDWGWEIAAIPVAFLFIAAALVVPDRAQTPDATTKGQSGDPWQQRVALLIGGALMLVVLVPAMQGARAVQDSDAAREAGDIEGALDAANRAEDLQPYAISPLLQQVPALQDQGDLDAAAAAATEATQTEPTNWRGWFQLAIVEKARGDLAAAERAFTEAVALNPQSTNVLVADPTPDDAPDDQ